MSASIRDMHAAAKQAPLPLDADKVMEGSMSGGRGLPDSLSRESGPFDVQNIGDKHTDSGKAWKTDLAESRLERIALRVMQDGFLLHDEIPDFLMEAEHQDGEEMLPPCKDTVMRIVGRGVVTKTLQHYRLRSGGSRPGDWIRVILKPGLELEGSGNFVHKVFDAYSARKNVAMIAKASIPVQHVPAIDRLPQAAPIVNEQGMNEDREQPLPDPGCLPSQKSRAIPTTEEETQGGAHQPPALSRPWESADQEAAKVARHRSWTEQEDWIVLSNNFKWHAVAGFRESAYRPCKNLIPGTAFSEQMAVKRIKELQFDSQTKGQMEEVASLVWGVHQRLLERGCIPCPAQQPMNRASLQKEARLAVLPTTNQQEASLKGERAHLVTFPEPPPSMLFTVADDRDEAAHKRTLELLEDMLAATHSQPSSSELKRPRPLNSAGDAKPAKKGMKRVADAESSARAVPLHRASSELPEPFTPIQQLQDDGSAAAGVALT